MKHNNLQYIPIKQTQRIILCISLICICISCSNDDTEEGNYPKTSFSKIELSQTYVGDALPVTTTQAYNYKKGRLTSYILRQSYTAIEPVIMEQTTAITYKNSKVTVTDAFDNSSTYTLNDEGYAISCIRQEQGTDNTRTYTFDYLLSGGKHYLKQMTECINNVPYASINIEYNSDYTLQITFKIDDYEQTYTAITANNLSNKSEIPSLFLSELYPLSSHAVAIYGKLLGDPLDVLIDKIIPDGNDENNETTTYNYEIDNRGIVTSCKEVINSYGTDYVRTVNYIIE